MLAKLVRDVIAGQLTVRLGMLNVHVNGQWNVVAADAATKEAMRTLLVPTTIYGIEVSPRELSSSSTGITVVDSITISLETPFFSPSSASRRPCQPVQSTVHRGSAVYLRFWAPKPPLPRSFMVGK